jgi:hypothetical protein
MEKKVKKDKFNYQQKAPTVQQTTTAKKGRFKKDNVTVNGIIRIEDGIVIHGAYGRSTRNHTPIKFELKVSLRDLDRLAVFCSHDPETFSEHLLYQVFAPAIERLKTGARGVNKGRESDLFWMKRTAGHLYPLFVILCNTPISKTPRYFQKLINMLGDYKEMLIIPDPDSGEDIVRNPSSGKFDPLALTAFCLEKIEGEERLLRLKIKRFFSDNINVDPNFENFRNRYVRPQLKNGQELIENKLRFFRLKGQKVSYVTKKGEKRPLAYNEHTPIADMIPCDLSGNELKPLSTKRQTEIQKKADQMLFKSIVKENFYKDIFKRLSLI